MQSPAPPHYDPGIGLLGIVMIVMICFAVGGAPEKLNALFVILGWMLAGLAAGLAIGLAFSNPAAAGSMAGLFMLVMGIGAAGDRMRRNKKKTTPPSISKPD